MVVGTRRRRSKFEEAFGPDVNSNEEKVKQEEVEVKSKKVKMEIEEEEDEMDYVALRERNIRQRELMFEELGLNEAKESASPAVLASKKLGGAAAASRRGLIVQKETEVLPPRKSLRLQRIDADTGLQLPEKEPTAYHVPMLEDNPRPPVDRDLALEDIVSASEKGVELSDKQRFLAETSAGLTVSRKPESSAISFSGKDVAKQLEALQLPPENVAKVVPNRIFSLAVHPSTDKLLVAAGGKWGNVGIWDVKDNSSATHGVQLFKMHSRPVNCMTFNDYNSGRELWTTSYDGTVRCFDLEGQRVRLLYGDPEDEDAYVTYHAQLDASTFLVTMGTTGKVGLVDTRKSAHKPAQTMQVYQKSSPKTVSIHPLKRDLFVCPNNKAECNMYDIRASGSKSSAALMKAVVSYKGHTKALSSAAISPVTGKHLVTVSYDNKVRLFDTDSGRLRHGLAHNNQTGRWLTTFKAEWHPLSDDLFFVGSMSQPRQIDAYSGDTGKKYPALKAEQLASVCSIVKCHPSQNVVVGGNSSGRVHVMM